MNRFESKKADAIAVVDDMMAETAELRIENSNVKYARERVCIVQTGDSNNVVYFFLFQLVRVAKVAGVTIQSLKLRQEAAEDVHAFELKQFDLERGNFRAQIKKRKKPC